MAKVFKPVKKALLSSKSVEAQKQIKETKDQARSLSRSSNQKRKDARDQNYDPSTVGFGRHSYSYIDPEKFSLSFGPTEGQLDYEDKYFLNKKSPSNELTIPLLCTVGVQFETSAPSLEGVYEVISLPLLIEGLPYAALRKLPSNEECVISFISLGVVADPLTSLYNEVSTLLIRRRAEQQS